MEGRPFRDVIVEIRRRACYVPRLTSSARLMHTRCRNGHHGMSDGWMRYDRLPHSRVTALEECTLIDMRKRNYKGRTRGRVALCVTSKELRFPICCLSASWSASSWKFWRGGEEKRRRGDEENEGAPGALALEWNGYVRGGFWGYVR